MNGQSGTREVKNHILFEIATEVANRVGGIYSVLKSKAPVTTAEYGDRYTAIGPLNKASVGPGCTVSWPAILTERRLKSKSKSSSPRQVLSKKQ